MGIFMDISWEYEIKIDQIYQKPRKRSEVGEVIRPRITVRIMWHFSRPIVVVDIGMV
jgi:hypothetical protein